MINKIYKPSVDLVSGFQAVWVINDQIPNSQFFRNDVRHSTILSSKKLGGVPDSILSFFQSPICPYHDRIFRLFSNTEDQVDPLAERLAILRQFLHSLVLPF